MEEQREKLRSAVSLPASGAGTACDFPGIAHFLLPTPPVSPQHILLPTPECFVCYFIPFENP